ncbi:phytanoyl-CoA dioxygenase family protein [Shewanella sp. MBTL60-007]|uniref:phytanoyl-CoA dioxygenase family protein n=1 Tax=Shewanella sp. MBTL60-007 TaxID=2815911 RepID=UPI001BBF0EC1|nr:phytanoyl-CoA dioxygenase family protein [Shewanella sp. MBTL60-007]GIU32684.1 SnoK protein [Shewanella sp. MBTL60-007]
MYKLKQLFERDGYVDIKGFLGRKQSEELLTNTEAFIKNIVPRIPAVEVYYEDKQDKSTLKQVQKLYDYDDYYLKLATSDAIVTLAESLLGGPVVLKNMQYFNKVPRIGKATPPHQDGYYFKIQPQQAITMWLSLGDADASNGAVCYVPGSHKAGMREHTTTNTLGFSQGISDWSEIDRANELQMTAKAGDLLVHHSLTIHRANANLSECSRQSIGFIFYRQDVVEDELGHNLYKSQLNEKLIAQGKV